MALGAALALVPTGAAVAEPKQTATRISVGYDGSQADGSSNAPSVSDDGRFFVYSSNATNLVPGDTNNLLDIFRYDRGTGVTELVTRGVGGVAANGRSTDERISADGRYVTFSSEASNLVPDDTDGEANVFVWDVGSKTITRLPGARSLWPDVSADGRYVTYSTYAALVPGDTDDRIDVYLHDRETGATDLVTRRSDGTASGGYESVISDDGRYVAFQGSGGARLFDRETGTSTAITGRASSLAISGDGAFVTFTSYTSLVPGDTNTDADVYLWERRTGEFTAVSVTPDGHTPDAFSTESRINRDGRYVTFWSTATNLSGTDAGGWQTQAYRYDRQSARNTLITVPVKGDDGGAEGADLSADGTVIGFMSLGEDLVADDTNGERDVFVTVLP
ncbi:TolB family protein [Actinoplanes teichomyceticus]|uniref:WD40 repeat protein n=1 Tax=Actinoplanes teichomyceticus TaxID=1867 RepID=A0A561VFX7_ACTTI|nr:PD40 domain-containing protein [Actinoplanes teichomyceticus]TWG10522.1 WD40 repeat protein [Actinoplanes teichomyceticus]